MLIERHGKPKRTRTDNGPEFRSKQFQCWLKNNDIVWSRIRKGKPQENAKVERFNRTYREDVLNAHVFNTIDEAQEITDAFMEEYNTIRPHEALNYQTPSTYAA